MFISFLVFKRDSYAIRRVSNCSKILSARTDPPSCFELSIEEVSFGLSSLFCCCFASSSLSFLATKQALHSLHVLCFCFLADAYSGSCIFVSGLSLACARVTTCMGTTISSSVPEGITCMTFKGAFPLSWVI